MEKEFIKIKVYHPTSYVINAGYYSEKYINTDLIEEFYIENQNHSGDVEKNEKLWHYFVKVAGTVYSIDKLSYEKIENKMFYKIN